MLIPIRILPVMAAALLLTGCEELGEWGGNSDRFKDDFRQTQALKPGGRLSVENLNGSIEITGWDRPEVEITGTKYASTEQALQATRIDVVASGDSVRVRTVPPSGHRGVGAKYIIHVPRRTELERIVSSNGSIHINDVEGSARLRTSNGSVKAARTNGAYEIETSNASVDLDGHNGPASVRTSNGQVRAENVRGHLDATTSNASITARLTDPEPGRPLRLASSNGSINLTLESLKGNDIVATTSNSSITVRMPGNLGAQLKARTSNSSVSTDFEVAVRGSMSKNQMEGSINGGGPVLDLTTSNGAIRVQRL